MNFQGVKLNRDWLYLNGIVYRVKGDSELEFLEACRVIVPGDKKTIAYTMKTPPRVVERAVELSAITAGCN